jgi:hypothetical protein
MASKIIADAHLIASASLMSYMPLNPENVRNLLTWLEALNRIAALLSASVYANPSLPEYFN